MAGLEDLYREIILDHYRNPKNRGELEALRGVVRFPVRIKCATLSWNTLAQVLNEAEAES